MYIEGFISGFNRKTALGHRSSIHQFLSYKFGFERGGQFCTEEELTRYEQLAEGYFSGKPNLLKDLKGFKEWQFKERRGPHSISQNIGSIRQWAEYHNIDLTSKEIRELKKYMPKGKRPVSREDEITGETIRTLLSHSPPKIKAMILIMISSGMIIIIY
jgi:integrase